MPCFHSRGLISLWLKKGKLKSGGISELSVHLAGKSELPFGRSLAAAAAAIAAARYRICIFVSFMALPVSYETD